MSLLETTHVHCAIKIEVSIFCVAPNSTMLFHFASLIPIQSQTPKQSTESEKLEQDQHLTKKLQVTAMMKSSSNEKESSKNTTPIRNKPTSSYRSIFEINKKDHRGEENAREDSTFDEYHSIKGKKEDDDSRPKSTNESTRANHLTNLLEHVELEQLSSRSRIRPKPVEEEGRT